MHGQSNPDHFTRMKDTTQHFLLASKLSQQFHLDLFTPGGFHLWLKLLDDFSLFWLSEKLAFIRNNHTLKHATENVF